MYLLPTTSRDYGLSPASRLGMHIAHLGRSTTLQLASLARSHHVHGCLHKTDVQFEPNHKSEMRSLKHCTGHLGQQTAALRQTCQE